MGHTVLEDSVGQCTEHSDCPEHGDCPEDSHTVLRAPYLSIINHYSIDYIF